MRFRAITRFPLIHVIRILYIFFFGWALLEYAFFRDPIEPIEDQSNIVSSAMSGTLAGICSVEVTGTLQGLLCGDDGGNCLATVHIERSDLERLQSAWGSDLTLALECVEKENGQ